MFPNLSFSFSLSRMMSNYVTTEEKYNALRGEEEPLRASECVQSLLFRIICSTVTLRVRARNDKRPVLLPTFVSPVCFFTEITSEGNITGRQARARRRKKKERREKYDRSGPFVHLRLNVGEILRSSFSLVRLKEGICDFNCAENDQDVRQR